MRILGIDPGIAITGWSVIDFDKDGTPTPIDYGAIVTEKGLEVGVRLLEIYSDLNHILEEFKPEYCGLETLLFYNNAKTAIVVGEARGVILLCMEEHNIPVHEFTPLQVKSSISGYGKATKQQVQENVKMICKLDEIPKPDDVADAIAFRYSAANTSTVDTIGFTMRGNGNVGIGVTAPSAKLDIATPTASTPTIQVGRISGQPSIKSSADWLIMDSNTNSAALNYWSAQNVILAYGGGNVGVKTASPGTALDVTGSVRASLQLISTVAIGTSPLAVTSTTLVSNLNADMLEGYHGDVTSTVSTVAVRNSSGDINTRLFRSEYDTTNATIGYIMTQIDTVDYNYIRPSTPAQLVTGLGLEAGGTRDIWVEKAGDTMTGNLNMSNANIYLGNPGGVAGGVIYKASQRYLHSYASDTGDDGWNTYLGMYAGNFTNYTSYNTGIGHYSLSSIGTAADHNTAVGVYSLYATTEGFQNTGIGSYALRSNTTGDYNTAVGRTALYYNTVANGSVAVGYQSQYYMQNAAYITYNTAIGYQALRGSTTPANNLGDGNTAIGAQAGLSLSSGDDNTLLGTAAGYSITSGYQNIIIGADMDTPTATTNQYLNIGGNIYGSLAYPKKVSLNTSTLGAPLTVYGDYQLEGTATNQQGTIIADAPTHSAISTRAASNNYVAAFNFANKTNGNIWSISSRNLFDYNSDTTDTAYALKYYYWNGSTWYMPLNIKPDIINTLVVRSQASNANANSLSGVERHPYQFVHGVSANTFYTYYSNSSSVAYTFTVTGTAMDLAEWYPVGASNLDSRGHSNLKPGETLCLDITSPKKVVACNAQNKEIIGIVSTQAFMTMGIKDMDDLREDDVQVALTGRVPLIVTSKNGGIKIGDYLTSSDLRGVAQKATKKGQTVAKAIDNFNPTSCTSASSLSSIVWPKDDSGENLAKPCFRLPDGTFVGKIMAFVNISSYDPFVVEIANAGTSVNTIGWYRVAQLDGPDDYAKVKINNTTFGSSQNLILSVDTVGGDENVNIISNFTTGGYDISKARVSTVSGIKYLEVYLATVNNNNVKVDIDGDISNWITMGIVRVSDTLAVDNEFEFKGLLFAVSETLDVAEGSVKVKGNLLTNSDTFNNIGDETNRWNDIYAKGAIRLGSGVGKEGAIRFNVELQVLEFSNDGTTWVQLGDLNSQVVISPEYPGAILFADGSDNFGGMTSDAEESTGSFRNYYEWVSDRETLQDYDILVRVTLPNDFVSWKEDAIYLDFMTENSASVNNNKVDMYLMGSSGIDAQVQNGISKLPGAWERISLKGLDISDCHNAGDTCTLRISLSSLQSYFVRVGDITLNYNRGL